MQTIYLFDKSQVAKSQVNLFVVIKSEVFVTGASFAKCLVNSLLFHADTNTVLVF